MLKNQKPIATTYSLEDIQAHFKSLGPLSFERFISTYDWEYQTTNATFKKALAKYKRRTNDLPSTILNYLRLAIMSNRINSLGKNEGRYKYSTIRDIYRAIMKRFPTTSLYTVYEALYYLVNKGLVQSPACGAAKARTYTSDIRRGYAGLRIYFYEETMPNQPKWNLDEWGIDVTMLLSKKLTPQRYDKPIEPVNYRAPQTPAPISCIYTKTHGLTGNKIERSILPKIKEK